MSCGDVQIQRPNSFFGGTSNIFSLPEPELYLNHTEHDNSGKVSSSKEKSALFQRIKYFEERTNILEEERRRSQPKVESVQDVPSTIKSIITSAREQFPNDEEAVARTNNTNVSVKAPVPLPRQQKHVIASENSFKEIQSPISEEQISTKTIRSSQSPTAVNRKVTPTPVKKLSIKSTINNAREQFCKENNWQSPEHNSHLNKSSTLETHNSNEARKEATFVNSNTTLTSKCTQFFSTGSISILMEETAGFDKKFKVLLRGYMYQNIFYSLKHFDQSTYYMTDEDFDYDLSDWFDDYDM